MLYPGRTRVVQNGLDDFPEGQFTILVFCDACGRSAPLDRSKVPAGTGVQTLPSMLRCSSCGSRDASMRIIYTDAGGYHHGGGSIPPDSGPTA